MTIIVVERPAIKYRGTCTDVDCRVVIECAPEDFKNGTRYSCGRDAGSYHGIVCPECNQILEKKDFEVVK